MSLQKILHVDDHQMVTIGLEQVVKELVPDVEFRSSTSIAAAFATLKEWQPNLIFLDLHLENESAMDHIGAIKNAAPTAQIGIYSAIDDISTMRLTIRRGAAAYIRKGLPLSEQRDAIMKFFENGYYFPPELANAENLPLPSNRKLSVLKLLAAGKTNKEIAKELRLSPDTVKTHVAELFELLGVGNRTEALVEAQKRGLV